MSPEELKANDTFKSYCVTCHSQQRVLAALEAVIESDESSYKKYLHEIIIKKIRTSNGRLSHQDAKDIEDFLSSIIRTATESRYVRERLEGVRKNRSKLQ
jgi:hypothetical protein